MRNQESDTKRRRIEMQGFVVLDERNVKDLDRWLRFTPAISLVIVAIGTILGSAWIMFGLLPFVLACVVLPRHPFDAIYNLGIRRWTGGISIPRHEAPRRFACAMASTLLVASGVAFHEGATMLGIVIGGFLASAAAVPVLTGFCIPAWIYQRVYARFGAADEVGPHCDGTWSLRSVWRARGR